MAIISMDQDMQVGAQTFGQRRYDLFESSDITGEANARLLGPPRWYCSISAVDGMESGPASAWRSIFLRLRGRINYLAIWDWNKPRPVGTIGATGIAVLDDPVVAGDTSIAISGISGDLHAGDWLQISTGGVGASQLISVNSYVDSSAGVIEPNFEPPLRYGFSAGTQIVLTRPVAYYKCITDMPQWSSVPGSELTSGFSAEFLEAW